VTVLVSFGVGCRDGWGDHARRKAAEQATLGVQAFRNRRYSEAEGPFREAVKLDPTFKDWRLYLAITYLEGRTPGDEQKLQAAKDQFNAVLKLDPKDSIALEYLGTILVETEARETEDLDKRMAKLDEARQVFQRLAEADPKNKVAFYYGGVIAGTKLHAALTVARRSAGMKPDTPGPLKDKATRDALRAKYSDTISGATRSLNHALELSPNFSDPMACLSLLYRDRADLAATREEYRADLAQSRSWMTKTLDARKQNAAVGVDITPEPTNPR
jgi:Tfp pilus assembly protein PilF